MICQHKLPGWLHAHLRTSSCEVATKIYAIYLKISNCFTEVVLYLY